MKCPACGWSKSQMTHSLQVDQEIHRRRQCRKCGTRYKTVEHTVEIYKRPAKINLIPGKVRVKEKSKTQEWAEICEEKRVRRQAMYEQVRDMYMERNEDGHYKWRNHEICARFGFCDSVIKTVQKLFNLPSRKRVGPPPKPKFVRPTPPPVVTVPCEWCLKAITKRQPKEGKNPRFCCRSCQAKWFAKNNRDNMPFNVRERRNAAKIRELAGMGMSVLEVAQATKLSKDTVRKHWPKQPGNPSNGIDSH